MKKIKVKEICVECGNSVKLGSGRFVNRIPDFDALAEKRLAGRPYPDGGFICAECESGFETENPRIETT